MIFQVIRQCKVLPIGLNRGQLIAWLTARIGRVPTDAEILQAISAISTETKNRKKRNNNDGKGIVKSKSPKKSISLKEKILVRHKIAMDIFRESFIYYVIFGPTVEEIQPQPRPAMNPRIMHMKEPVIRPTDSISEEERMRVAEMTLKINLDSLLDAAFSDGVIMESTWRIIAKHRPEVASYLRLFEESGQWKSLQNDLIGLRGKDRREAIYKLSQGGLLENYKVIHLKDESNNQDNKNKISNNIIEGLDEDFNEDFNPDDF